MKFRISITSSTQPAQTLAQPLPLPIILTSQPTTRGNNDPPQAPTNDLSKVDLYADTEPFRGLLRSKVPSPSPIYKYITNLPAQENGAHPLPNPNERGTRTPTLNTLPEGPIPAMQIQQNRLAMH